MPIKPEHRALYPKDWPAISRAARERAQHRCQHQGCEARQYDVGWWSRAGDSFRWVRVAGPCASHAEAKQRAADEHFSRYGDELTPPGEPKIIVIVLTVAHLNHDPTDCRPENLAAMCQRHHLAYDHDHHRANSQATRRAKAGTLELF